MNDAVWTLIIAFLALMAAHVPISVCIGLATAVTMMMTMPIEPAVTQTAQKIATGLDSFALLAIPLFVLSGHIMGQGGIAKRLINMAKGFVGNLPGGLAFVNIISCMLFGAISGSAVAATSAIGSFMIPEMNKAGYDKNFSAAANATAATTGLLIPPSNVLIVYSLASGNVSVAALFVAGYMPRNFNWRPAYFVSSCSGLHAQLPRWERKLLSKRRLKDPAKLSSALCLLW